MTSRLNLMLVLALVASALYLVRTSYEGRSLFAELDRSRNEQARLEAEFKRLEAEVQLQATHGRIDRTARERLAMRPASPAVTQYVVDGVAAASGAQP